MPSKPLADKVVIITGGAQGIGRALSMGFARAGAKGVVIIDRCKPAIGRKVMDEIDAAVGGRCALFVSGDVTKPADCRKVVARAIKTFGAVHILVNNAALGERATAADRAPFWKFDEKGFLSVMAVNIAGPFNMSKAVTPHMIKRGWGRILNVSKTRESMHAPFISAYGSSKAALEALSLAWAVELLDTGVTVNSFNPGGPVDTDFMTPSRRKLARSNGRILQPEIVVPIATWLASEKSDGITGCRYNARKFDGAAPSRKAAEAARDPAIFLPPRSESKLIQTWKPVAPKGRRRKSARK